jgi:hypothetical protein
MTWFTMHGPDIFWAIRTPKFTLVDVMPFALIPRYDFFPAKDADDHSPQEQAFQLDAQRDRIPGRH